MRGAASGEENHSTAALINESPASLPRPAPWTGRGRGEWSFWYFSKLYFQSVTVGDVQLLNFLEAGKQSFRLKRIVTTSIWLHLENLSSLRRSNAFLAGQVRHQVRPEGA
jgi:hypothetical protein